MTDGARVAAQVPRAAGPSVLALGFRPLFLLAPLWSAVAMAVWLSALGHAATVTSLWHAHEMVFGFGGAVVAGFLLTAVRNWTGLPTVAGWPLAALLAPWLVARVAALAGEEAWRAAADALFLAATALVLARPIVAARQWHNLRFAGYALALAVAAAASWTAPRLAAWAGLALILALLAAVGGRVIPFFIERRIPGAGTRRLPWTSGLLEVAVLVAVAGAPVLPVAPLGAFASALAAWRTIRWSRAAAWREPMLAVLLAGQVLLAVGLAALAVADAGRWPPPAALHLLAVGAMGLSMFGMMARVALGHTGRPIVAGRVLTSVFVLVAAVALVRGTTLVWLPEHYLASTRVAALGWVLAALLLCWRLAPVVTRPRVDGRAD